MSTRDYGLKRKAKLLLIEDNVDQIFLIKQSFENRARNSLEVDVVTDGEEAISYVKQIGVPCGKKTPDLIILDLKLPKRDGFEVLKQLKSDDNLRLIPVVVFSSSDREVDITKSYQLGANSYIMKPISGEAFDLRIEEISKYWLNVSKLPTS